MNSWRNSTCKSYSSYLRKWEAFAFQYNFNVWNPDISDVLEFLTFLIDQGCGYSVINTARSALSTIINVDNLPIGKHSLVKRFVKGVYNIKPSLPRYTATWDVNLVLNFLKSMDSYEIISLKYLTYKLVTLLALCTGQRCQTLSVLELNNMNVFEDRVIFRLTKLLKHSRPGVHQKPIDLKSYPDKALCVVKCLEVYIHRTAHLRDCDSDTLLISFIKPYHKVSTDTIARWIKTVLRLAGIDTSIFKAHSTRSASTSAATKLGVPLQDIMSSAGWSSNSTFGKFYNKDVVQTSNMGDALLSSFSTE